MFAIRMLLFCVAPLMLLNACNNSRIQIDTTCPTQPVFRYQLRESHILDDNGKLVVAECQKLLNLRVVESEGIGSDVMVVGDYTHENHVLSFKPRFELSENLTFEVRYGIDKERKMPYIAKRNNNREDSAPVVKRSFPLGNSIPANILTFYIEFDQPMLPDPMAFQRVKLLDEKGHVISRVWREKSYWINDNKVLVMMIHPGRVKNGIHATYNLGKIFTPGKTYSLQIEKGFNSLTKVQSERLFKREFTVSKEDKTLPLFHIDQLAVPDAGSKNPLMFSFSEQMDYGLLWKWLRIGKGEAILTGELTTNNGIAWSFQPDEVWTTGGYQIRLKNKIADVAHNQMDRLFEMNEGNFTRRYEITYDFEPAEVI